MHGMPSVLLGEMHVSAGVPEGSPATPVLLLDDVDERCIRGSGWTQKAGKRGRGERHG